MHSTMIKAESSLARSFDLFNPFTAPACKISGLKGARTRMQTV